MSHLGIVRAANLNKKNANPFGVFFQEIGVYRDSASRMSFIRDKTALASILNQLAPVAQAKLGH